MSAGQKSVGLKPRTYEQLKWIADNKGVFMSEVLDEIVNIFYDGIQRDSFWYNFYIRHSVRRDGPYWEG